MRPMIPGAEMVRDRWQVSRHEQFPTRPDGQSYGNERLKSNRLAYPSTLFGCSNQTHQVGNRLRSERGGPGGPHVAVGIEDRDVPFIEMWSNPRSWLSGPAGT